MRGPQALGLSDRQRQAIAALLVAHSTPAAAKAAGVAPRTLRLWLTKPDFREAYEAAARQRFEDGVHQLRAATSDAVATLRAALDDPHCGNRIRAAAILLDVTVKLNLDELTRRVEALEAAPATPMRGPLPGALDLREERERMRAGAAQYNFEKETT